MKRITCTLFALLAVLFLVVPAEAGHSCFRGSYYHANSAVFVTPFVSTVVAVPAVTVVTPTVAVAAPVVAVATPVVATVVAVPVVTTVVATPIVTVPFFTFAVNTFAVGVHNGHGYSTPKSHGKK